MKYKINKRLHVAMSVAEDVVYRYIDAHFRFATPRNAATVDDTRHAPRH